MVSCRAHGYTNRADKNAENELVTNNNDVIVRQSVIFSSVQTYWGILRHTGAWSGIIEAYSGLCITFAHTTVPYYNAMHI